MPDPQTLGQITAQHPELTGSTQIGGPPEIDGGLPPTAAQAQAHAQEFRERFNQAATDPTPADGGEPVAQAPEPKAIDSLSYLVRQRAELTIRINELTSRRDDIDQVLKDDLDDAEVGTVGGRQVVHWTTVTTHRLSQTRLKQRFPDVYDDCLEASTHRRFTLDVAAVLGGGQ